MGIPLINKYKPSYDFEGKRVLNLGCGNAKFNVPNVVNLDGYGKPDVLWDLEKTPLPFENETFDFILAHHILEHLHNWWNVFDECARILKPNGTMEIYVPAWNGDSALGFRDHVSIINSNSFYGCFDIMRPCTNAWAETQTKDYANLMTIQFIGKVLKKRWWLTYAPRFLKDFFSEHLLNTIEENRFFFRKVTLTEFKERKGVEWIQG